MALASARNSCHSERSGTGGAIRGLSCPISTFVRARLANAIKRFRLV